MTMDTIGKDLTTEQIRKTILLCNAGLIHAEYFGLARERRELKKTSSRFETLLNERAARVSPAAGKKY